MTHGPRTAPALILLAFVVMCLIWGSTWMVIKVGLQGAPPLTTLSLRFWFAAFLVTVTILARRKRLPRQRSFYAFGVFLGIFHLLLPYALVYWAEQHITSSLTAVLYATMPLMVALLARVLLGNALTRLKILGILVGLAGVTIIYSDRLGWSSERSAWGIAAVLSSVFFSSWSSVVLKKRSQQVDPMTGLLVPYLVAGVVSALAAAGLEGVDPRQLDGRTLGTVLYLAGVGSFVAFSLYFWTIQRIDVTLLSYQTFIIPLLALLFGWVFLGELVSRRVALGTLFILGGIALANLRQLRLRRAVKPQPVESA